MFLLGLLIGAALGIALTAWRLKGDRTWSETARAVIMGGGGPGELD